MRRDRQDRQMLVCFMLWEHISQCGKKPVYAHRKYLSTYARIIDCFSLSYLLISSCLRQNVRSQERVQIQVHRDAKEGERKRDHAGDMGETLQCCESRRRSRSPDQRNKPAVTPFLASQLFLPCGICWLERRAGGVVSVTWICCCLRSLTLKKA